MWKHTMTHEACQFYCRTCSQISPLLWICTDALHVQATYSHLWLSLWQWPPNICLLPPVGPKNDLLMIYNFFFLLRTFQKLPTTFWVKIKPLSCHGLHSTIDLSSLLLFITVYHFFLAWAPFLFWGYIVPCSQQAGNLGELVIQFPSEPGEPVV